MTDYKEITMTDVGCLAAMYIETFYAPPWNDKWIINTASKRLHQMINTEDFYGLSVYLDGNLCGMILFTSKHDDTEGFYLKRGYESYSGMIMMGKQLK